MCSLISKCLLFRSTSHFIPFTFVKMLSPRSKNKEDGEEEGTRKKEIIKTTKGRRWRRHRRRKWKTIHSRSTNQYIVVFSNTCVRFCFYLIKHNYITRRGNK